MDCEKQMTPLEQKLYQHMLSMLSRRYDEPIEKILESGHWYVLVPYELLQFINAKTLARHTHKFGRLELRVIPYSRSAVSNAHLVGPDLIWNSSW